METARRGRVHRAEGAGGPAARLRRPGRDTQDQGGSRRLGDPCCRLQPGTHPERRAAALPRFGRRGLTWIEEPLRYDDLDGHARVAGDIATPVMLGENFYGPRAMHDAIRASLRPGHAGPDADRRRDRLAARGGDRRRGLPADVLAFCTRSCPGTCCGSPRPGTGWSGRTGPAQCSSSLSRSAPASCTCPTCPAPDWTGTRMRWRGTEPSPDRMTGRCACLPGERLAGHGA
jgi:Enolase C-terminal domain-like